MARNSAASNVTLKGSGAKIVLDLPATREWLETNGVTVLGWQCDEMPGFYSRTSGLDVDERVERIFHQTPNRNFEVVFEHSVLIKVM